MPTEPTFAERLAAYKHRIDEDIANYAAYVREVTAKQYGEYAVLETEAFLDMLSRGGKRIRGALVIAGYEMSGGGNQAMITQAARAIEMLHAYILIVDDIQDRSGLRRGKPTIHRSFTAYHHDHALRGDAEHAGVGLALNAAMAGNHAAQIILANLDVDLQLRTNVVSIANRTMGITVHGQMYDMMNEMVDEAREEDIEHVLEWKTALYTFINPLHVGMVLAGADCHATDAITPYGLHAGKAFQITDDILGIFGEERELGKSPFDDIREGKMTLIMAHALAHAPKDEAAFLRAMLGNQQLTAGQFERCRAAIDSSGALQYARKRAAEEAGEAIAALGAEADRWPVAYVAFLRDLVRQIQKRRS